MAFIRQNWKNDEVQTSFNNGNLFIWPKKREIEIERVCVLRNDTVRLKFSIHTFEETRHWSNYSSELR